MTLEVAVDGYGLEGWSGTRGIGTYVRNLLTALEHDDRVRVTTVRTAARAPERARALEHELRLPRAIRAARPDVFHSPSPEPPRRCPVPWAQTLFDVIPMVLPDAVPAATRKRFARLAPLYRRADAVIAISKHAADEGVRLLELDPARVHVVPLGVDASFTPGPLADSDAPPYALVVGGYEPRKRLEHAFEVVARLAEAGHPHRLHVAGAIAPFVEPDLRAAVARAPRPDRIDLLGRVEDLAAEYRGAAVVLHPSSYEGFGLPLAEAMACGVPVVAYRNSSVPEVLEDAGVLVADGDVDALTKATRRVLDDSTYRAELVAAGLVRAAGFRWEDCARAHVEVFLAIAER
jgi:alpha-1,3-rhamnosyl/mannosyltransferase